MKTTKERIREIFEERTPRVDKEDEGSISMELSNESEVDRRSGKKKEKFKRKWFHEQFTESEQEEYSKVSKPDIKQVDSYFF